ncbi:MAG: NAD(P)-dependent oxidoreductase [Lawsonibacter sp.]|nr:NAD(P)-dependent oxidoreductase [Lawsonibacter sp.]
MEILLIGTGQLAEALIDRFNKNGERVYLLTGQREPLPFKQHVFETYNFSYDDESIKDIFDSIKPDITIFTGAWDSYFNWEKARQESVRYTAALINILTAYTMRGSGRFVYLSSQEVFTGSFPSNLPEGWNTNPKGFRSMAIAQGEDICANYCQNQGLDIRTLRLDHMYCVPKKGRPTLDPCCAMCLEALRSGKIFASDRDVFSMLFVKDAAELACKAITAPKLERAVYHISAMEEINGLQLAQMIQESMGSGIEVIDESVGEYRRVILDGTAFSSELGQRIFTRYPEGVKQVVQFMKRNRESFIRAEDAGGNRLARFLHRTRTFIAALVPYVENVICGLLFFFLNKYAAGSDFFDRIDLFLLYVLLFAVTLGQRQAVFSGLLASFGYCLQQMYTRSGFAVLLDYNTYVWMAQLFIVGMVVGYIRDQLHTVKRESQDQIAYLEGRLNDIAEINDSNVRMKENFEIQLVNQKDSLGKIYDITSTLEQQAPEEVLFTAVRVLSQLMDCGGAAIYTVANRSYARLFSSTSKEARSLGHSIEYTAMTEMYDELKERRVFINKSMRENLPLMASAVYSEDGMELIFMLWGIPWQRMTMAEANRLAVIGQMVQTAVVRANQYLDALSSQRYVEGSRLMAGDAFLHLARAFLGARDQGLTECALLEVPVPDRNCVAAASALSSSTRQSDYMGSVRDGVLYVLLSNTSSENAGIIQKRFLAAGYESRLIEEAAL